MANQPSSLDYGVYCVVQVDNAVIALTNSEFSGNLVRYESFDGGVTWEVTDREEVYTTSSCEREFPPWEITDPVNAGFVWRMSDDVKRIEQSQNSGNTWTIVYETPPGQDARNYYYRPSLSVFGPVASVPKPEGPYNGVVDKNTGNLIVSMGFDGVIVITREQAWYRSAVGPYTFLESEQILFRVLIPLELTYAIWLALLGMAILVMPLWTTSFSSSDASNLFSSKRNSLYLLTTIVGVVLWLIFAFFMRSSGFLYFVHTLVWGPVAGWILYGFLAISGAMRIKQQKSIILIRQIILLNALSVSFYIIPLLFWSVGIIPIYLPAASIGILASFGSLRFSYHSIKRTMSNENLN